MVEQVEVLKERYEALEKRKRHEVSGYQSDIRILRQKVRQVEQQLIRASLAKAKGKEIILTIYATKKQTAVAPGKAVLN